MLPTRSFEPRRSNLLSLTINFETRLLLALTITALALCFSATTCRAQYGSLSIGQVTNVVAEACPTSQWYPGMNCFSATLTGCANVSYDNLTFGYLNPTGTANGTIVFFNGADGTDPAGAATGSTPGETQYITDYLGANYQVVQVAWANPWEQSLFPYPGTPVGNVQAAGCRPATFLNYVFNSSNMYQGVLSHKATAGMCAQGASAGSAAIAYSLTYYGPPTGTQWWLDNVELISGPTLSDIEQGCEVPGPPTLTNICPSGQYGCRLGAGGSSWSLSPTYLAGPNAGVGSWTDDNSCANGTQTTQSSNAKWLAQSIVDQGTGTSPIFKYQHTAMSAWLCRSVANQQSQQNCSQNYTHYDNYCPNNSSSQGEIYYAQIGQSNSPPSYNVYAVDSCGGPEGASSTGAYVLAIPLQGGGYQDGYDAIKYDMIGNAGINQPAGCTHPQ